MILAILALLSLALTLWQWLVAFRFPLHKQVKTDYFPSITLLKPLKGVDTRSAECLESWLAQRYPNEVEVLFGVASAEDPVCDLVRRLIASYPKANAKLVICPENLGANAKVSTLIQLMRIAQHEVVIISDADVWVPQDFLSQLIAPLKDAGCGLVNSFYQLGALDRCDSSTNLAMRWEAFAANADFWSQVLQSQSLKPLDFALGAVMATRRAELEKIGGFESLADYLADDYQLGHQIAAGGACISLCPVVVECRNSPMSWRAVWKHQLRWARTIRVCQPVPYFFSQLHNATLWPCLCFAWKPSAFTFGLAVLCLLARVATAFYCERKLTRRSDVNSVWLAPMKDLLQTVVWALAFLSNRIEWRGRKFKVLGGGKLVEFGLGKA